MVSIAAAAGIFIGYGRYVRVHHHHNNEARTYVRIDLDQSRAIDWGLSL